MSVTLVDGWELMVGGLRRLRHARAWMVAVCLLAGAVPVKAQVATDLNEGLQVTKSATTGVFTLSWWGQAGRTYFIQQSFDLMTWHYVPVVLSGSAAITGMNFSCAESRQFWKLRYTDDSTYGLSAADADFDYDGLSNQAELNLGLDPFNVDTDGDELNDGWEVANNLDAKRAEGLNGAQGDPDSDGLVNLDESYHGTDPHDADSDNDTLSDFSEVYVYFTYPNLADSDGDGLSDSAEVLIYFTAPLNGDTDGDSLSDEAEVNTHHTNPLSKDTDGDGLDDHVEINTHQTNPNAADSDNDGITDKSEIKQGTNANSASSRPAFESIEVVGDGAVGVRKTKQLTITLPQGERSYMVVIAAMSDEYPQYTGDQSEFDDVVEWKITPAGGTVIQGEKHVNDLHEDWEQSVADGTTYLGLSPVAIVKIETIQGKASGTTSVQIELGAKNVSDALLPSTLAAALLPIDIEPDTGMAGVVGDVVKSAKAGSIVEHFVTPKKSTELNQDYVELKAVGITAEQITPGHANQIVEWEGGEAGSTADKRKVKRDAAGKTEVNIKTKQGGTIAVQMNVWVVWADIALTQTSGAALQRVQVPTPNPPGLNGPGSSVQTVWDFKATIQPATIINDPEHPDFSGAPKSDVPNRNAKHANDGAPFGQPTGKWDISRQMRCRILSPQIGTKDMYDLKGLMGGTWYDNLPNANIIQPTSPNAGADSFPQDKLEGNDDGGAQAEDNDPYTAPNVGMLTDSDPPSQPFVIDQSPAVGNEIEFKLQFREFCRLEIGGKWFLVSDQKPWRLHGKLKKAWIAAQDDTDGNGAANGNEGQMRDTGSVSDATNNDW